MPAMQAVFDCHFHILDPAFPPIPNEGYLPPAYPVGDYLPEMAGLGLRPIGGVIVTASFQGDDPSYLRPALAALGPTWRAVIPFDPTLPDAEIDALNGLGVRAMRLNIRRGGGADPTDLLRTAERIADLAGWHMEFYLDAAALAALRDSFARLPKLAIDHMGLSGDALPDLLALAARGAGIKATGFSRFRGDPGDALRRLQAENPGALMFGSDLPSTRAPRRFGKDDIEIFHDAFPPAERRAVLFENGARFYGVVPDDRA